MAALTLVVHNAGHTLRNVEIKDQSVIVDVGPGETAAVQVKFGAIPIQYL